MDDERPFDDKHPFLAMLWFFFMLFVVVLSLPFVYCWDLLKDMIHPRRCALCHKRYWFFQESRFSGGRFKDQIYYHLRCLKNSTDKNLKQSFRITETKT